MAAMKIHGSPCTTATMRALAALHEKELDFEFVQFGMATGKHKKEPFINLNPFGQVPAFQDGDLTLYQSRAITQYVAQEYAEKGTSLISSDSKKMAIIRLWMEVETHQFDPASSKLAWELATKPTLGMVTDEALVEENEARLSKVLDIYEFRLAESKYLACDCFTLADLHHLPTIHYIMGTKSKKLFDSRPNVCAWVSEITSRPAWLKVVNHVK